MLRASWLVYLRVWGITFLTIFLLSFAIPPVPPSGFIDATAQHAGTNLLELIIPANPFVDLVQNHLTAIVIFSILFGIALQRVDNKASLLSMLDAIRKASVTLWSRVVLLAPVGVFASFANTVGNLEPGVLIKLSLYLRALISGTVILAFWILPSVVAALCPTTTRDVIKDLQSALVIAVVTTLSVAAQPYVQSATEKMAAQMGVRDGNSADIIQTTLAVSYPLGQLGNFLIWFFILFAAFYYGATITPGDAVHGISASPRRHPGRGHFAGAGREIAQIGEVPEHCWREFSAGSNSGKRRTQDRIQPKYYLLQLSQRARRPRRI